MAETASISSGIAGRYAAALFDLAREEGSLDRIGADAAVLSAALADSADFRTLITSPLYTREDQGRAVRALAGAMGLSGTMTNLLSLMAAKRRLFVLPQFLADLRARLAAERGEVEAEVVSAAPLAAAQKKKLAEILSRKVGRTVTLTASVDESLIGGLVVKVGSQMIDTSVRAKLAALQNSMKEVG